MPPNLKPKSGDEASGQGILEFDKCHVWWARPSVGPLRFHLLEQSLSPTELHQAASFRFPKDRLAYIFRHGVLRNILGCYLGIKPREVCFSIQPGGKPQLQPSSNPLDLRFNISRTEDMALFALTRSCEVGVDIESVQPLPDRESIARVALSRRELEVLSSLPEEERMVAFFRGWTRKEAMLKALGDGIGAGTSHLDVNLADRGNTGITGSYEFRLDGSTSCPWSLFDLLPAPGFAGAVAIRASGLRLVCRPWLECGNPAAAII